LNKQLQVVQNIGGTPHWAKPK